MKQMNYKKLIIPNMMKKKPDPILTSCGQK